MKLLTVALFVLAIFFLIMWVKPSGHDRELEALQNEKAEIEARLRQKDDSLENSLKREIALRRDYSLLQTRTDSAVLISTLWRKKYLTEKGRKPTAILEQGQYDSLLSVLYPH